MASNRYQYTLQFNADTQAAKKSMQDLANSFEKLFKAQSQGGFMDESINKAVESAKQLEIHLQKATDVNTGKLNLTEFNKSIQQAGTSFKELSQSLVSGGAAGQQAFLSMASAIAQSEVPLKQMNSTLKTFAQTLKNTVKWEISSNIVHGLESAMGNAVSYAKNLNTSLTNIRIVTGQTVEDMAKFTAEANKAAKSLSTTTKAYADASLIYYQQGDSQEQVAKKAAITIKAANSSFNTSAAEMSEYLTAVWNSYQVGADELERYVDIMAALGAKTATSLEEIATSMQKVAATANTVGVSMEQVSSIVATVSSVTRESAESIGTSYKTIFARIGDLKLGETLDDGVTLGQVSSQLDKIGVSVLDANGEMRDMGAIIEDLGSKWQTMSRAEQTAIAQVVAGKRQYTQLMALFENWDMYQQNMTTAQTADGSLQNMADTYAESWEAASARVTASLENIYNKIINDQAIIKFTNGISGAIDVVGGLIDALGGMSGTIGLLGSIGVKVFEKQIAGAIDKTKNKITTYFGQFKNAGDAIKKIGSGEAKNVEQLNYQKAAEKQQNDFKELQKQFPGDDSNATTVKYASELLGYKEQLLTVEQALTEAEKQAASTAIAGLSQQQADIVALKREKEELLKTTKAQREEDIRAAAQAKKVIPGQRKTLSQKKKENDDKLEQGFTEGKSAGSLAKLSQPIKTVEELYNKSQELSKKSTILESFIRSIQTGNKDFEGLKQKVEQVLGHPIQAKSLDDLEKDLIKIQERTDAAAEDLYDLVEISFSGLGDDDVRAAVQEGVRNAAERGRSDASIEYELYFKESSLDKARKTLKDLLNPKSEAYSKLATNLTKAGEAVGALTSGLGIGANLVSTMSDETVTLGDKLGAAGGALTSLISSFATGGWIGLAASAIGMIISGISEAQKRAREMYEESINTKAEEAQTKIDTIKEENAAISELLPKYGELAGTITSSSQISGEYQTAVNDLTTALGFQGETIDGLIAKYHSLDQAIIYGTKTQLEKTVNEYEQAKNDLVNKAAMDLASNTDGIYQYGTSDSFYVDTNNLQSIINSQNTSQVYADIGAGNQFNYQGIMSNLITTYGGEFSDYLMSAMQTSFDEAGNFDFNKFYELIFNQVGTFLEIETDNFDDSEMAAHLKKANNLANFIQQFDSVFGDTQNNLGGFDFEDNSLFMLGQLFANENQHGGTSKGVFSKSWLGQLASGGSLANLTHRDQSEYWSDYVNVDSNLARETAIADSVEMSESAKAMLAKMRSGAQMTAEELYQFYLELTTLTEEYPELANDATYKALHAQFGTIFAGIQEPLEAAKTQLELIENGMDITALKQADISSVTELREYINDVYKKVTGLDTPAPASFMKSASELLQLWGIIPDITNTLVNELSVSAGIAQSSGVSQDTVLTAMDAVRQDSIWQDASTPISYEDLNWNHLKFNEQTGMFDRDSLLAEIAYAGTQKQKDAEATSIAGIKTLQGYDLNEIEALGKDGFEKLGIKFDSSIEGFENVSDVASWLKLNAEDRETYLTKLLEKQEESYYAENGILQQAITADTERKIQLENMYNEAIASQEYAQATSAVAAANKQIEAGDKILSQRSKITDADIMTYLKELYGENFSEDLIQQYEIDAWRNAKTDEEARQTSFYQKVVSGQTLASENVVEEQAYLDTVAGYNAESVALGSQIETNTNAKEWAGLIADAGSSVDTFGNSIKILTEDLNTLNTEFSALNSIDVSTVPKIGTQAYEALSASLKKAGKTMSDYRQMSEKDRIKAVGQAKKENLEAQKAKQKEIENKYATKYGFNASTTQADILATGDKDKIAAYEAWIAAQEAQADLADEIAQEVKNTADELIRVGAANTDAAIARFEQEQTKLQTAAEQLMNVADILTSHITDGELNFAEQAQLDPKVLAQWNSLSTSAERAKFAAEQSAAAYKKQMEYQQNINEGITGAQTFANGIAVGDMLLSNNDLYGTSEQFANWLDTKNLSNSVKQALVEADKTVRSTLGDGATAKQWGDAMRAELATMGTDGAEAFALIEAQGKDALSNIFSDFSAILQEEAQNAVDAWANAFKQIADARKTLIAGGSLLDQIAGDPETLLTYLQSYRKTAGHENATAADLVQAITSGTIKAEDLAYGDSSVWTDNQMKKYGLNTVGLAGKEFGTANFLQDKSAIARMLGFDGYYEADADQKAAIDKQVLDYYTGMIAASEGINEEAARIKAQNAIANNEYGIISNARKDLADSINASATAQDAATKKTEAMAKADEAIETYNEAYEKEQQKQSDWTAVRDAAKAVEAGDATDIVSALGDKAPEIADRLGMSLEQLNQINVDTATQNIKTASIQIGTLEGDLKKALEDAGVTGENQVAGLTEEEKEKYADAQTEAKTNTSQASYDYNSSIGLKTLSANDSYDFLEGLDSQFKALDAFELEPKIENLNSLRDALDLTNPSIAEYYNAIANAESAEEREAAIDDLTTALLTQGEALLTNSEGAKILLENYAKTYGITDEFGEVLTTQAINAMKTNKRFNELNKTWKKTGKQIKANGKDLEHMNKTYDDMTDLYKDVAKAAKKTGKSIGDITKDLEGMTDEEKKMIEQASEEYLNIFKDLETGLGDTMAQLPQDMADAITGMDLNGLINSLITPESFGTLMNNVMGGSEQVQAAIAGMAADNDAAIRAMGEQLQAAADANGNIDLGTVLQGMGVDVSNPIAVLEALKSFLQQLAGTPYFTGAEAALGPVISALSAAQGLQSKYGGGGGGGGAKNANNKPNGNKGGGGGSKNKTKEDKLRYEDEVERYHEQNKELERVQEKLDMIDKMKERTYGKKHLAQLDAETAALREQAKAQADLYNEANKWRASDQAELISLGVGIKFDENGNIANYEEVMQALIDKQNENIERYNNSEQEEGDKLRYDADKQWYEDAVQAIEDYEEALKTGNEALIEMEEIKNRLSEIALEKITYELEIETDLNENDLELFEYFVDKWEDDLSKQDESFIKVTQSIGTYQDNLTNLSDALADLNAQHSAGEINEADYVEGMQEIRDQIMENLENLEDAGDQLKEIYSNALELAREEIDKTTEAMQHSSDVMESYISIMGLMGKANDFESLQSFYDAQYTYGLQQIGTLKSTYDTLIAAREEYDAKIEAGQKLSEIEQANYDALQEQIMETEQEMLDATESTLEAIQAGYENTVNKMSKDLEEFMVGAGNSIAGLADQYAYFQEKQDRYVSTAKELFEVSKLNRDIENSLADATTDASKEALKALQEKINKQSELNELTEYDIQMNQLEYQLLLARIQLEEASSSKDTVRLTRDENGNYAYQYTADQDKVNEAMQQYEDVLQQINELSVERTGEIEQQMIDAMQNNLEKFNEIMLDETLSTEERNQKIADLNTQFSETMLYLQEQAGIAGENLTWNQEMIAEHFGVSLSDITASTAGNVNDSVQAMIDRADEFAAKMNAVLTGDGEDSVQGVWEAYKNKLKEVSDTSGLNYETMTNKISQFTTANDLAAGRAQNVLDILEDTLAPLTALTAAWGIHANMIESMVEYYEQLAAAMSETMRDVADSEGGTTGGTWTPASSSFEDKGYGPYEVTLPDGTKVTHNATGPWSALAMAGVPYADIAKVNVVPKFLKGGLVDFTGLAQLDGTQTDPELVLNSEDTRNMLQAVNVVRQLDTNTLALLVSTLETSVNSLMAFMGSNYHASGVSGYSSQTLDQNVQITAEFPNVTSSNEIEEAFNSLVNRAAQFAMQK